MHFDGAGAEIGAMAPMGTGGGDSGCPPIHPLFLLQNLPPDKAWFLLFEFPSLKNNHSSICSYFTFLSTIYSIEMHR